MTVNYTTLLRLVQPVTGTESGTWGDYVNNALTAYLDVAVAGTQTLSADANATLTLTDGTNTGTGLGATSAQYAIINMINPRSAIRTVTLPSSSRHFIVMNNTSGGYAVGILPGGVTVSNGERCVIAYDTSTSVYVKTASSISNLASVTGTLGVANGGTGATTLTANNVLLGNGTSAPLTVAPSTSGNVLRSNGTTWQSTNALTLETAVNTTSGTTVTLAAGLPTWVKRVTLSFANVSTGGSSAWLVQLSTGGGYKTSGYDTGAGIYATSNYALTTTGTAGFVIYAVDPAVDLSGHFVLTRHSGNAWVGSFSMISTYGTGSATTGGGNVTLDGDLFGIRLNTVTGTDTFDGGSVAVLYE